MDLEKLNQNMVNLELDVLMKITKKNFLIVGILLKKLIYSQLFITESLMTDKNYHPAGFQAAIVLGFCFPYKLFKHEQNLNLKIFQGVSRVVESDYIVGKPSVTEDVNVVSTRARPTMLMLTLEFNLVRSKKEKDAEEK